jgi:cell division protein FtsB
MKTVSICLLVALIALQYKLWKSDRGVMEWVELNKKYMAQKLDNKKLIERNHALSAEIIELKSGDQALEEQARSELGMIKQGEVYYQFVD